MSAKRLKKNLLNLLPGFIWAIVILLLTGLPGTYFPEVHSFWDWLEPDKVIHLIIFGSLSYLIIWGFRDEYAYKNNRNKLIFNSMIAGVIYGGLTEILQETVFVGRDGNIYDFMANTLGVPLGILLFHLLFKKRVITN